MNNKALKRLGVILFFAAPFGYVFFERENDIAFNFLLFIPCLILFLVGIFLMSRFWEK